MKCIFIVYFFNTVDVYIFAYRIGQLYNILTFDKVYVMSYKMEVV
jgi:hypothetical protein